MTIMHVFDITTKVRTTLFYSKVAKDILGFLCFAMSAMSKLLLDIRDMIGDTDGAKRKQH